MNWYQEQAKRTINKYLNGMELELHAVHGMASEVGEIHAIYQKAFQGHEFDISHALSEVGDLLWFIAEWCTVYGVDMDDVMKENIEKLKKRYPEGFEEEKSLHRTEGDI